MTSPDNNAPTTQPEPPPAAQPAAPAAEPPATSVAAPAPAATSPTVLDNLVASMGMAQLLIVGGAAVIVALDLVLGVVLRLYPAPAVMWAGSATILFAFLLSRRAPALLPASYQTLLVFLAAVVALVAARNLLLDVFAFLRPPLGLSATGVLGMLLFSGAAALMAWGAWQMSREIR